MSAKWYAFVITPYHSTPRRCRLPQHSKGGLQPTFADALQLVSHHLEVEGEAGDGGGGGRRESLAGYHPAHLLQVGKHIVHWADAQLR